MSQDVFQMQMDQFTNRLSGIIAIHDDICVYGRDTTEHERNPLQLMQTTSQGFLFKSSKCSIHQPQISFYGAVFMAKGMKPDPAKVKLCKTLLPLKLQLNSIHF